MTSTTINRDAVLASRIALAIDDARELLVALEVLLAHPPITGREQEDSMNSIDEHISHAIWRCSRLREFVK